MPLAGNRTCSWLHRRPATRPSAELIAAAKKKPGELNFASAGTGSGTHINAEKFRLAAGIDAVHIPYKGTPEAITDTMTGPGHLFLFADFSQRCPTYGKASWSRWASARRSGRARCRTCRRSRKAACRGSTTTCGWACLRPPARPPTSLTRSTAMSAACCKRRKRRAPGGVGCGSDAIVARRNSASSSATKSDDSAKVIKAAGIKVQ